ncbi:MAG: hypothetical protein AAB473_03105 [Patescibacteria group bacterium]
MDEKIPVEEVLKPWLAIGDSIRINEKAYEIIRVVSASDFGKEYGIHIARSIPVYYVNGVSAQSRGAYQPEHDIVLVFTNTDEETLRHELTHVVEYHQEKIPELLEFYERAKRRITEDSFEEGFTSFNFMKDIHEFIADGRTKPALIAALKKEGLYDEFMRVTEYLFVAG